jgi:hypothetical protein
LGATSKHVSLQPSSSGDSEKAFGDSGVIGRWETDGGIWDVTRIVPLTVSYHDVQFERRKEGRR